MHRLLRHLQGNAIAYLALFVALGGTSYAAVRLPTGSVGNRQLKNHSVTPIKLDRGSIAGYVRDWAAISPQGTVIASRPRAHLAYWSDAPDAASPGGFVVWSSPIPASCVRLATATQSLTQPSGATYASATPVSNPKNTAGAAYVRLSLPQTGVNVVVICPQP